MTVWVLEGYDTGAHNHAGYDGVRHREYTRSARRAERFARLPKIQFTDSGHGIVFDARPHRGRRKPLRYMDGVAEKMRELERTER